MTFKIKICGLSTLEHIDMVVKSKADMAGFIFANPSPREIKPYTAKKL
ncbi:MAG: N-(5'-phosphoribosyl)anthranilate isomerase, partial [Alphaproteobacteria bacterium]|nr:N-(5'-phosphoribosyl)anthranilate isomerase [Alphaproteobacteria bacterium]